MTFTLCTPNLVIYAREDIFFARKLYVGDRLTHSFSLELILSKVGQLPLHAEEVMSVWHVGRCSPAIAPFEAASWRRQDRDGLGGGA